MNKVSFLGVDFTPVDRSRFLELDFLCNRDRLEYMVTPNVDHVVRYNESERFRLLYSFSDYVVCDSNIVLGLSRLSGVKVGELITGSDLSADLLVVANNHKLKVMVVGTVDVAILKGKYDQVLFEFYDPAYGFLDDENTVGEILHVVDVGEHNIIMLCVGSPTQEELALILKEKSKSKAFVCCVGASLKFLTGEIQRSPVFMQKIGLEWLFRLLQEPKRLFKRYVKGLKVFYIWFKLR